MKNYKLIISLSALLSLTISSCQDDILEAEAFGTLSSQNQTDTQVQGSIASVYGVFTRQSYYAERYWLMFDLAADDMRPRQPWQGGQDRRHFFDRYQVDASIPWFNDFYSSAYQAIAWSNAILDIVEQESEVKTVVSGEAHFLRALAYLDLVRVFGGVPLITSTEGLDLSNLNLPRATEEQVFNQIESDLEIAADLLPEPIEGFAGGDFEGRATKGSALALLARAHLFQKEYQQAKDRAEQVMNLGVYDLFTDYADAFRGATENGVEHIFSLQFNSQVFRGNGANNQRTTDLAPRNFDLFQGLTQDRVELKFSNEFPNDYRKEISILDYDAPEGNASDGDPNIEVPHVRKFSVDPNDVIAFRLSEVNYPIIRFSDVLLMFAEAENELNGPTGPAIEALNRVRRRARGVGTPHERDESVLPDVGSVELPLAGADAFRDLVLRERHLEFCFEGQRYFDLRRTDRYLDMLRTNFPDDPIDFGRGGLFPIPQQAIDTNPELTQNPGY